MPRVHVTPKEHAEMVKLQQKCSSDPSIGFDAALWVVGLACLFGMSVEELRERAGNFPAGSMTEVVVSPSSPAERWEP